MDQDEVHHRTQVSAYYMYLNRGAHSGLELDNWLRASYDVMANQLPKYFFMESGDSTDIDRLLERNDRSVLFNKADEIVQKLKELQPNNSSVVSVLFSEDKCIVGVSGNTATNSNPVVESVGTIIESVYVVGDVQQPDADQEFYIRCEQLMMLRLFQRAIVEDKNESAYKIAYCLTPEECLSIYRIYSVIEKAGLLMEKMPMTVFILVIISSIFFLKNFFLKNLNLLLRILGFYARKMELH